MTTHLPFTAPLYRMGGALLRHPITFETVINSDGDTFVRLELRDPTDPTHHDKIVASIPTDDFERMAAALTLRGQHLQADRKAALASPRLAPREVDVPPAAVKVVAFYRLFCTIPETISDRMVYARIIDTAHEGDKINNMINVALSVNALKKEVQS